MDRREFIGLVVSAVLLPALGSEESSLPAEYLYKGWSIEFNERPDIGPCVQGYATNGKLHGAILFDQAKSAIEIRKQFELWLDRLEKRAA